MFTWASKRSRFRTPFGNQRVNGFETLLKSAGHHYFPLFPQVPDKLNWEKSALVISEVFRLFVNTLTHDDKYSRCNMQIFWQQLETPLSPKGKSFWTLLFAFLKCPWNLEHSQKKKEYPGLIITETIASERDIYLSVWKVLLRHTIR